MREEKEAAAYRDMLALKVLRTAYKFESWMQDTGAGASYSTFCDDFGYEGVEGESRPAVYKRVLEIIRLAKNY